MGVLAKRRQWRVAVLLATTTPAVEEEHVAGRPQVINIIIISEWERIRYTQIEGMVKWIARGKVRRVDDDEMWRLSCDDASKTTHTHTHTHLSATQKKMNLGPRAVLNFEC